ncbi:MAG TPA: NAD(P)-dependent alcohol dehydrogenase [Rhodothermales bacterium]|nr:NAD(P)-dependent alcohol dehydrogenase [Rhodothermales bacterium]
MQAIQYKAYGSPAEMQLTERKPAPLKRGELLIEIHAASINPVDWKIRQGEMKMLTGSSFPRGMGSDFAGVVAASNAPRFKPGDEVFGFIPFKTAQAFGEQAVASADLTVHKPAGLSFSAAACLPMAATTALRALKEKGGLQAGMKVLVNGCTGGVGVFAVQIAKALGAEVAGTCNASSLALAKELGADMALDYKKTDILDLPTRFDLVFDTPGTLSFSQAKAILQPKGIFLELNPKPLSLILQVFNSRLKPIITSVRQEDLEALAHLASQGKLRPFIGHEVSLQDAIPTLIRMEEGVRTTGKTVIRVR